jgi:hypothetical protein
MDEPFKMYKEAVEDVDESCYSRDRGMNWIEKADTTEIGIYGLRSI